MDQFRSGRVNFLNNNRVIMVKPEFVDKRCIQRNKLPNTTIAAFEAISDTWNVLIYMHIMDINTT